MKQRPIIVLIVLAIWLSLIAWAQASDESKRLPAATTIGATKDGEKQRVPCTERRVQALALRFIEAFNAGDAQRLDRLFAPPGDFLWYVLDGYTHTDRTTLVRYFEQEHSDGVGLRLTRFRFTGYGDGYGGFEFFLVRTTRQGAVDYHGKGASICHPDGADVIAIWSMGRGATPPVKPAVVALTGSVGPGRTISLKRAGETRVTSVAPGLFRITVRDRSRADNFHLFGRGLNKKTGVSFRGTVRWLVRLNTGRYVYKSDRHKVLRRTFRVRP
jgi:Domain of unknown function (DUF4440)